MAADGGVEINLVELDVADDESVRAGFAEHPRRDRRRVDVLVNNAGVGGNAVAEECSPVDLPRRDERQPVRRGALPAAGAAGHARPRQRGASSTSPRSPVASPRSPSRPYVTSKWAFEGFSEGLAQELAPFGIRVVIIEPGVTKSAIFAKNIDAPNHTGAYDAPLPTHVPVLRGRPRTRHRPVRGRPPSSTTRSPPTTPKLRYAVSWGGHEIVAGRASDVGRSVGGARRGHR